MYVDKKQFYQALSVLAKVVPSKVYIPILGTVRLEAHDGILILSATDLTQTLLIELPASGELQVCLPLLDLCSLTKHGVKDPNATVVITEPVDGTCKIETFVDNVVQMEVKMLASLFEEFPATHPASLTSTWPVIGTFGTTYLKNALGFVLLAACKDVSRLNLHSVFFNENEIVTTDGHRLHKVIPPEPIQNALLIPKDTAAALHKVLTSKILLDPTVVIRKALNSTDNYCLAISTGAMTIISKICEGTFPDYRAVIPPDTELVSTVFVDAKEMRNTLMRLSKQNLQEDSVELRIASELQLIRGSAMAIMACEYTKPDVLIRVTVNIKYLIDSLRYATGTVKLLFTANPEKRPMCVNFADKTAIIMPILV